MLIYQLDVKFSLWPVSNLIRLFYWHVSRVRVHVIALDNGGSKASIRLSGRGRSLFSTIAKHRMFGLGMVPKEGFLAYSIQSIYLIKRFVPAVMVANDMCGKSPITGEWIYGITWKDVLAFMFFVYYLFVCLMRFLHFCICNVWLILANNRILVFILEFILFLSLSFKVYNNVFTCKYAQIL